MPAELTEQGLFPAEHRALRELHATARQVRNHWGKLATRIGGEPAEVLRDGADAAASLLAEIDARVQIEGRPSAQSLGARLAGARGVTDLLLERNQAFRSALLDLQHVTTLVGYLAALAHAREDTAQEAWLHGWEHRLRALEDRGRSAIVAMAKDPEHAIAPADAGPLGRAGARVGVAIGSVGEAIDHSPLGRLARRRAT